MPQKFEFCPERKPILAISIAFQSFFLKKRFAQDQVMPRFGEPKKRTFSA